MINQTNGVGIFYPGKTKLVETWIMLTIIGKQGKLLNPDFQIIFPKSCALALKVKQLAKESKSKKTQQKP